MTVRGTPGAVIDFTMLFYTSWIFSADSANFLGDLLFSSIALSCIDKITGYSCGFAGIVSTSHGRFLRGCCLVFSWCGLGGAWVVLLGAPR